MATTPYELVNGIYLDNRNYMKIISFYTDWSYLNKIEDETASNEDIKNFIRDIRNLTDCNVDTIKAALYKYFKYLNREHIVN